MAQLAFDTPDASGLTRKIAENGIGVRFDALPPDVVSIAKCCLIDWLGVTLAGAQEEMSRFTSS